jgi:hypothetical protein
LEKAISLDADTKSTKLAKELLDASTKPDASQGAKELLKMFQKEFHGTASNNLTDKGASP